MSDSWSLKGLRSKKVDGVLGSFDAPFWFYHEASIDTLRLKLIEDVKSYRDFSASNYHNMIDMVDIINKRFGVDLE